ncbi:helix-turn-helix domain-containing protein [Mycobacteroides abscessus]|uniref:helix-turn-helix domain-containing protein n=1 Tax=Mycobacteroides abscessus TaxID=36809 RepID=UPI0009274DE5|nr:helix-turn-helix domain-containing protein [Mycobacteroides abscessus]SIN33241.1 transcriptional regulator, y4mF family [Mycobacteroides abscessus subsp. abscessus]
MGTNEAERLGQLVVARRIQLGLRTSVALAEAAGLTTRVISDLESGRRSNFSASTKAQIEGALKWHTGSIDDALKGGEPRPVRGAGVSDLLPPRSDTHANSEANAVQGLTERRERIREGVDTHRKLFAEMLAEYLVMSARNAKFLENSDDPAVHENRAQLAEFMYNATRSVAIHFLVQLDPSWDVPEVVDTVSSLLTPADRETLESSRETYIRAYEILDRISGPARPADGTSSSNVTNLADRRPVPPPPDLDDLDVAASRREKQSDGERDDDE